MKVISFLGFNPNKRYDKTTYISPDGSDKYPTEFFQEALIEELKNTAKSWNLEDEPV